MISNAQAQYSWVQLGHDIDGDTPELNSGESVSLSARGDRVAIGAPRYSNLAGLVRIYEYDQVSGWIQLGSDIVGEAASDVSGAFSSLSLSANGKRVAIGAIYNDGNGNNAGHVRIYEYNGSNWVQLGADIDGKAAWDLSGQSVSLSFDGSRVAIGAPGSLNRTGQVRIYEYVGGSWIQLGTDIDGEAINDAMGFVSLSQDGSRVAIGSPRNDGNGTDAGQVRVYQYYGKRGWRQLGADIDGETAGDFSAVVALSADGNRVAIGAPGNDNNGIDAGHVRIYEYNPGTWSWVQLGSSINGVGPDDHCGVSVSLTSDGSRVAVGMPKAPVNGPESGRVRMYEYDGNSWVQLGGDINAEAAYDLNGHAVSLSASGNRVAIGAFANDENGNSAGHTRIFSYQMSISLPPFLSRQVAPEIISLSSNDIQISTNPIQNNILRVHFKEAINSDVSYQIYDMLGRVLLQGHQTVKGNSLEIQLQNQQYNQNNYILQLKGLEIPVTTLRLVKE